MLSACAVLIGALTGCTSPVANPGISQSKNDQELWAQYTSDADRAAKQGDKQEAERLYKLAIDEAQKLGQANPDLARAVSNMANFYYAQGDGDRADRLYQKAIAIKQKTLGTEHVDIAEDLIGLGKLRYSQGRDDEGLSLYRRAAGILTRANRPVPQEVSKQLAAPAGNGR